MKTRTLFVNADVSLRAEEGQADAPKTITGYGAVFYDGTPGTEYRLWDGAYERIMPGAFDEALNGDVRGLFNHNPNMVLGRTKAGTMEIGVDKRGLWYRIKPGNTTASRDVMEYIERGDVTGSSFMFRPVTEEWKREDDRDILEVRKVALFETGPVTFPAYEAAESSLRAEGDITATRRSHEAWLQRQAHQKALREKIDSVLK